MIHILAENLVNQIAAGEVIERPASVVKELVENAIDADATRIEIEILGGGKKKISVRDNGWGMSREDARLSFERHATSKINILDDLFKVKTLGFRGEALPSIAAVSELRLTTRTSESDEAFEIRYRGGKKISERVAGAPIGTEVVVENLFFNTPARLKFLKSEATEVSRIAETLSELVLAWPQISFICKNEGKLLFHYAETSYYSRPRSGLGAGSSGNPILERLLAVLREKKENFLEVKEDYRDFELSGFIAIPSITVSTSRSCYTFVNGRPVRDRTILHAISSSYEGAMAHHHYPKAVLYLKCDGAEVDVNVHPTKREVRFREPQLIHQFIEASLKKCLNSQLKTAGIAVEESLLKRGGNYTAGVGKIFDVSCAGGARRGEPPSARRRMAEGNLLATGPALVNIEKSPPFPNSGSSLFTKFHYIGQLKNSYLLCEDDEHLIFIDQHAAHERIAFNRLKKEQANQKLQIQPLLVPLSIEMTTEELLLMEEKKPLFEKLGFEIDYFGGKTVLLKAIPQTLLSSVSAEMIREILRDMEDLPSAFGAEQQIDHFLSTLACHSARTARERLQPEEIHALLSTLDQLESAPHCPHGRPFSFSIRISEIEKKFHR